MNYRRTEPPEFLFYASDEDSYKDVFEHGLNPQKMASIELFESEDEARKSKRVNACAFVVLAKLMLEDGYVFYRSESGQWLTDEVPPRYIRFC